ncbi:MAG TPA: deoxyribose-phosphate aldolase [Myxococcales bacterium]|nr:deoxyribose-phosphate aldolase [Myxococcales bacterium]
MADQLDELAAIIAEKALQRLRGERPHPAAHPPAVTPAAEPKECNIDGCSPCEEKLMCSARELYDVGTARLTPLAIRTSRDLAPYIDHTLLKPDATRDDLIKLCDEARKYGFATVCVNSSNVPLCARLLQGSSTRPIAVVGFPLGAATTSAKVFEAREAVRAGAAEIDMVINIGQLKARNYAYVQCDIREVVAAAKPRPVKVILETGALTRDEKVIGCALSKAAGAAFVKTSTGFGPGGATAEDVALMRQVVGDDVGVKASGGVRTTADAQKMVEAGANRLGASASVAIVTGVSAVSGGKY